MAGVSTDTVGLRVKPGSFVVKRGSSILNEKLLDKILGKKPKGYAGGGTVPINATPEERIATPVEVAMYGIDFFRAINNSSDNATHPERMDALIAQSELAGMKPMYDGGEVAPGYENGGNVPKSILNIPFSLLANILNKPVPRTSTVLSPEEQILMELESGAHFPKTDVPSPEEEILSELINVAKQKEKDRPIASPFKGYQDGDEVPKKSKKELEEAIKSISEYFGQRRDVPAEMQNQLPPHPMYGYPADFTKMGEFYDLPNPEKFDWSQIAKLLSDPSQKSFITDYQEGDVVGYQQG